MRVYVDYRVVERLLDTILPRWQAKKFPYNKRDAIIPQNVIPKEIAGRERAIFYFYICIYMHGGIESLQAFNALLRMRAKHPWMFDPVVVQLLTWEAVQPLLKEFIGWDSESASKSWIQNSRQLVHHWNGNPLNLIKGITTYEGALKRMRNKHKKHARKQLSAGKEDAGFRGFQPKMVSMLVYFFDWEGWLKPRFLYPAPADFHNFRLGFNQGAIVLPSEMESVRIGEDISKPWRDAVMRYLVERKADPIEVADALWMFSLVMCGNSPAVRVYEEEVKTNGSGMFDHEELRHETGTRYFVMQSRKGLESTCLRCPLIKTCTLAIPSKPYYTKGLLMLNERARVEKYIDIIDPDKHPLKLKSKSAEAKQPHLIPPDA